MEQDFSDEFCAFVQSALPSVDAAEFLLHLTTLAGSFNPSDAVVAMRPAVSLSDAEGARLVALFQARGLLAPGPDLGLRFAPASAELAAHVATLARLYDQRPVTLIRLIYALRDAKV